MSKYKERTRRITFDTPISLRDNIHALIPPSTLSAIMRNLLVAVINLYAEEGGRKTLSALLSGNIEIRIIPKKERSSNES